jgi:hypothetical protein
MFDQPCVVQHMEVAAQLQLLAKCLQHHGAHQAEQYLLTCIPPGRAVLTCLLASHQAEQYLLTYLHGLGTTQVLPKLLTTACALSRDCLAVLAITTVIQPKCCCSIQTVVSLRVCGNYLNLVHGSQSRQAGRTSMTWLTITSGTIIRVPAWPAAQHHMRLVSARQNGTCSTRGSTFS